MTALRDIDLLLLFFPQWRPGIACPRKAVGSGNGACGVWGGEVEEAGCMLFLRFHCVSFCFVSGPLLFLLSSSCVVFFFSISNSSAMIDD